MALNQTGTGNWINRTRTVTIARGGRRRKREERRQLVAFSSSSTTKILTLFIYIYIVDATGRMNSQTLSRTRKLETNGKYNKRRNTWTSPSAQLKHSKLNRADEEGWMEGQGGEVRRNRSTLKPAACLRFLSVRSSLGGSGASYDDNQSLKLIVFSVFLLVHNISDYKIIYGPSSNQP